MKHGLEGGTIVPFDSLTASMMMMMMMMIGSGYFSDGCSSTVSEYGLDLEEFHVGIISVV